MKASETSLRILLEGQKQFAVPLFQRPYRWKEVNWDTLWTDILETYASEPEAVHFLGSIVSKSLPGTPEGVSPFVVIDGQQRLTTIVVLLAAMRDAFGPGNPQLAEKLNDLYIRNRFVSGLSSYKVLPTQADRTAFLSVVDGSETDGSSLLNMAYRYFLARLVAPDPDGELLDPGRLDRTVLSGLLVVSITLGSEDNEYRIFESLNAKGRPLRQVDLLKNYLFMRLPPHSQEAVYRTVWLPMEEWLAEDLEDFLRYEYLSSGQFVREGDVYQAWRERLDVLPPTALAEQLVYFAARAQLYARLVHPELEPEASVAEGLRRLNRWGGQTMYPFLLTAYQKYADGQLKSSELANLIKLMESFLVRRLFVGVPTNALNRLFTRLAYQLPVEMGFVAGVHHALSLPSRRWPRDDEFLTGIMSHRLYTDSRPEQRRLILEAFEAEHRHKEAPSIADLTIEHIMPQQLTPEWWSELGPNADDVHRRLLHVLGNLTLTGYNPELSNSPWPFKRGLLAKSNLEMNKELAAEPSWREDQITTRSRRLGIKAAALWPGPKPLSEADEPDEARQVPSGVWADFYLDCIHLIAPHLAVELSRVTDTLFKSDDGSCTVVCLVSKEYEGGWYWWTFRSRHEKASAEARSGYVALGCGSPSQTLLIPFGEWEPMLEGLNCRVYGDQANWHVQIRNDGGRLLLHRKGSLPALDVTRYLLRADRVVSTAPPRTC